MREDLEGAAGAPNVGHVPHAPAERRTWTAPVLEALPKLTDLTLVSDSIGGGGDTGGGGSTVF